MAIRFYCQRCGQLLSIASRKAGTLIDCPKCDANQEVPSQEAGDAAISLAIAHQGKKKPADIRKKKPKSTGQDDGGLPTTPLSPFESDIPTPVEVAPDVPPQDDYILLSRRTIYLQGILFAVVALLALGMGFLIGIGGIIAKSSSADGASDSSEADPVLLEGRLTFGPAEGPASPDHNAVVIILPEHAGEEEIQPAERISTPGIRPLDPPPAEDYGSLRRIGELGGCYARADEEGRFSLVLPDSGRYHLLLISRSVRRTDGSDVDDADLDIVARYFRRPKYLIGDQMYRLTLEKFEGRARVEHNFVQ